MSLVSVNDRWPAAWPSIFQDFFNRDWLDWSNRNYSVTNTTLPSVNIRENDDAYQVEMAAPGMEKDDFNIELNNNVLRISSEKKAENKDEKEDYTRREFSYQSFSRTFTLPLTVESDKISARYDKGVLHVEIPKKEEAKPKPPRKIAIG